MGPLDTRARAEATDRRLAPQDAYYVDGEFGDGGVGDPVLGLCHTWLFGSRWALVADGAVKLAVRGEQTLVSTGANEYGLQASLQRKFKRQGAYFSAAFVQTDGRVPASAATQSPP